jgi:DNA polymerase III delta subunit
MITLLTGDNQFLLTKRRKLLEAEFATAHSGGFGLERYDAEETAPERLNEALTVLPFLSGERLVVIHGATRSGDTARTIQTLLERIPDTTHAVFVEPSPDRRTSLYKALQKVAKIESFEVLRGQTLQTWLIDYAREQGFELANQAANELARRVGTDQWALAHEIQKLALLDIGTVGPDKVELHVEPTLRESIFDLLEKLIDGDGRQALSVYRRLREGRVESFEIIAMIGWQVQILSAVTLGTNRSLTDLARDTGFKPFSLERVAQPARRLGLPALRKILQILSTVDTKLKSSRADKDALLEVALVRSAQLLAR